ncbi:YIP1 family protein, partial [Acinetobacter baumannii]
DALAPQFGGERDAAQAMKVAVFSMIPLWLATPIALIPGLGIIAYAGLYSPYLAFVGLPRLMRAGPDRALIYVAAV